MSDTNLYTADSSTSIDYKQILVKALRYWYLLAAALLISGVYGWYQVRYAIPTYSVDARILLKDEYSSWGQEYFLPGLELVSARNRLVNEIGSIRSFPLMREVIEQLPHFSVFYYDIGKIKNTELYRNSPFTVRWDTITDPSIVGQSFHIQILSKDEFRLGSRDEEVVQGEVYHFETPFELNGNSVMLVLNDEYRQEGFKSKLYSFKVNNLDRLAIYYQSALGVASEEKESSILIVSRNGPLIEKEIDFINKFIEVYIDDGLKRNNQIASNVMLFVDDRINSILDTLMRAEGKLESFKVKSNLERINPEGENLIPGIVALEKKKIDLEFDIAFLQGLVDNINENEDVKGLIVPGFIANSVVLHSSVQGLIDLYTTKMKMKYDITTSNDSWKRLNDQIKVQKEIVIVHITLLSDKARADLKILNDEIEIIEYRLGSMPSVERDYYNIQRGYRLNNDLYTYLLKKKAEASIAKGSNVSNVTVLDWATTYRVSYLGPDTTNIYLTAIIMGLAVASVVIFLLQYFDDKIRGQNDVEAITEIPTLGLIGHNQEDHDLVLIKDPKSVVSESFRSLRTSLTYLLEGKDKFCVLVTSSISQEGKTFCTMNLASAFAILGKKTVILGADMRKPKIFEDFGLKNDIGMSNYLINQATLSEIIQPTGHENIVLISAGPIPPNPSELIGSERMEQLMKELKEEFDVVVIDTPPLCLVTDALQLTEYSDANIYIVRHNVTSKSQLKFINEIYKEKKVPNLGIVVNDFKRSRLGYSYDYGYGYGYGYGTGYIYGNESKRSKSFLSRLFS